LTGPRTPNYAKAGANGMGSVESNVSLTRILHQWTEGDTSALEQLAAMVYEELHRIATRSMAQEREGHLLQPSALVNELFVRLMARENVGCSNRVHFFARAARMMRNILTDFARSQKSQKRGCGDNAQVKVSAIEHNIALAYEPVDFVDLNAALDELEALSPRQASVVELRYFGGLDIPEVATALGISEPTVVRDWRVARAWLFQRLQSEKA
jgi:RNA polymerase sigma factor (TIGR02999 family)